jgi:hypothetical protein
VVAGLLGSVVLGVYLAIILRENNNSSRDITLVAAAIGGASIAAFAGSMTVPRPSGRALLRLSAAVFLILGLLGILTIGLPLLLAGALCLVTSEAATNSRSASA